MSSPSWLITMTFFTEGVLLMMVASMGLVGNILSFVVLKSQKVHKTFHNLLILLNTFDMVSKPYFITLSLTTLLQIYLLTSISMFSLPNLSSMFSCPCQSSYQWLILEW